MNCFLIISLVVNKSSIGGGGGNLSTGAGGKGGGGGGGAIEAGGIGLLSGNFVKVLETKLWLGNKGELRIA